jgi:hypothetical protein
VRPIVDHTLIADDLLDRLPAPAQIGASRVGGADLNQPRIRHVLSAVLPRSAASGGFTLAEFTAKVHAVTEHTDYTIRQAAYDLRKLHGTGPVSKPGRTRRYHLPPRTAGTIAALLTAALLTLREQVIAPILAGVRSPPEGPHIGPPGPTSTATTRRSASTCKPSSTTWASAPPGRQHFVDQDSVSV